jgi:hypothetical protein
MTNTRLTADDGGSMNPTIAAIAARDPKALAAAAAQAQARRDAFDAIIAQGRELQQAQQPATPPAAAAEPDPFLARNRQADSPAASVRRKFLGQLAGDDATAHGL